MVSPTTKPEELVQRKAYFSKSYATLQLHNKKKSSFKMALNKFSAMVTIIFVCVSSYTETKSHSSFWVEPQGEETVSRL